VKDDGKRYVVRVYGPWQTTGRLAAMQDNHRFLATADIPHAIPIATRNGSSWATIGDRLVEVEPYVETEANMDNWARLEAGLPLLGRIHSRLRAYQTTAEGHHAPASNSLAPEDIVPGVQRETRRLREWHLTDAERDLADTADELAWRVSEGRLLEAGTHDELMARSGDYAAMFAAQAEWYR